MRESSGWKGSVETIENNDLLHRGETEDLVLGGLCAGDSPGRVGTLAQS